MCSTESRAPAEDELKGRTFDSGECRERPDDKPVFFYEGRARQLEVLLDFKKVLERGPIVQLSIPHRDSGAGAKSAPSRAQQD